MIPKTYDLSTGYTFDPWFSRRNTSLTILEFSSKWMKDMLPYREGGGRAACSGGGSSLMTQSAGSVNTQRKAFKYV